LFIVHRSCRGFGDSSGSEYRVPFLLNGDSPGLE
jgi:hypothetical protein